eukprot:GILJ01005686.1.p1 GENE.GILJ01005686.1~~GILJ01005686.1.p1  ORF type:complete len:609 (+),score=100.58 GILJ01005686.1:821-2647(+)
MISRELHVLMIVIRRLNHQSSMSVLSGLVADEPIFHRRIEFRLGKKQLQGTTKDSIAPLQAQLVKPAITQSLFSTETVESLLGWKTVQSVGAGIVNVGNTCFLNSILQSLSYCPSFRNYVDSKSHSSACKMTSFCLFCLFEQHVQEVCHSKSNSSIKPVAIIKNLRNISRHFKLGQQEDPHEFFLQFLDTLQKSSVQGNAAADSRLAQTSVIYRLFAGTLLNQIKCLSCGCETSKLELFLDLPLVVDRMDSVEKALRQFFSKEKLTGKDRYRCTQCRELCDTERQLTMQELPAVLTLVLKRYKYSDNKCVKIDKPISFTESWTLDSSVLIPSQAHEQPTVSYKLCAILIHTGPVTNTGHHSVFVRNSNEVWYHIDDATVRQVSLQTVLSQKAYMLFYERQKTTVIDTHVTSAANIEQSVGKATALKKRKRTVVDAREVKDLFEDSGAYALPGPESDIVSNQKSDHKPAVVASSASQTKGKPLHQRSRQPSETVKVHRRDALSVFRSEPDQMEGWEFGDQEMKKTRKLITKQLEEEEKSWRKQPDEWNMEYDKGKKKKEKKHVVKQVLTSKNNKFQKLQTKQMLKKARRAQGLAPEEHGVDGDNQPMEE